VQNGQVQQGNGYTFNPPWTLFMLLPLGFLSMGASWGVIALLTFAVLVASVPRVVPVWRTWAGIALLCVSFLALRQVADGNLEFLVIAGTLLIVYGYRKQRLVPLAAGILLATSKPQEVSLLMLVLAAYIVVTLPPERWLRLIGLVAVVLIPTMLWRGEAWLGSLFTISQRGSLMDLNLYSGLMRTGVVAPWVGTLAMIAVVAVTLSITWATRPTLSREKAAMLIAASLLAAPYSAANSILTVLAIGVIPLFQKRPLVGLVLILLSDIALFMNDGAFVHMITWYWTGFLTLVWLCLCAHVWNAHRRPMAGSFNPVQLPRHKGRQEGVSVTSSL
jgi:hypothetical protein